MSMRNGENSSSPSSSPTSSLAAGIATTISAAAADANSTAAATAASSASSRSHVSDMWNNTNSVSNSANSSNKGNGSTWSNIGGGSQKANNDDRTKMSDSSAMDSDAAAAASAAATAAAAAAWSLAPSAADASPAVWGSSAGINDATAINRNSTNAMPSGTSVASSGTVGSGAIWGPTPGSTPGLVWSSKQQQQQLPPGSAALPDGAWGGWDRKAAGPGSSAGSVAHSQAASSMQQQQSVASAALPQVPQLPPAPLTKEQELIETIVNSNEGWGSKPINQTTPWDIGESPKKPTQESLVWNHEPNNGTSIWESFYENRGERPGKWDRGQIDPNNWTSTGSSWTGGGGGWGGAGDMAVPPPSMQQQPPSMSQMGEPWRRPSSSSGGGGPGSISDWSAPVTPGTPSAGGGVGGPPGGEESWKWDWRGPPPPLAGGGGGGRGGPGGGGPMGGGSGGHKPEMRANLIRHLVDIGFSKEDATAALISCNMNVDMALNELRARSGAPGTGPLGSQMPPMPPPPLGAGHPMQHQMPPPLGIHHQQPQQPPPPLSLQQQQQQPPSRAIFPGGGGGGGPHGMRPGPGVPPQAAGAAVGPNPTRDLMRDQIIQQLRLAVQNRIISPNTLMPNQNMSQADLKLVHQLIFHQNQLHALTAQQQKIAASMRSPQISVGQSQATAQLQDVNQKILLLKSTIQQLSQQLQSRTGQGQQQPPQSMPPTHQPPPMQQQLQLVDQLKNFDMGDSTGGRSRYDAWNRSPDIPDAASQFGGSGKVPPLHSSLSNPSIQQQQQQQQYQSFQRSYSEMPSSAAAANALISGEVMDKIPEFVPGQPWAGGYKDGLFSVTHETLEQHLNSSSSDAAVSRAVNRPQQQQQQQQVNAAPGSRWQQPQAQQQQQQQRCLLIRQLNPQINRDVLSMICNQQGRVLALHVGPMNQWAMVKFGSRDEADKATKNISSLAQQIVLVSDADAETIVNNNPVVSQPAQPSMPPQQQQQQQQLPAVAAAVGGWPAAAGWGDQGIDQM